MINHRTKQINYKLDTRNQEMLKYTLYKTYIALIRLFQLQFNDFFLIQYNVM